MCLCTRDEQIMRVTVDRPRDIDSEALAPYNQIFDPAGGIP